MTVNKDLYDFLRNPEVPFQVRCLVLLCRSYSKNWVFHRAQLMETTGFSKNKLTGLLKKCEALGYLRRTYLRSAGGKISGIKIETSLSPKFVPVSQKLTTTVSQKTNQPCTKNEDQPPPQIGTVKNKNLKDSSYKNNSHEDNFLDLDSQHPDDLTLQEDERSDSAEEEDWDYCRFLRACFIGTKIETHRPAWNKARQEISASALVEAAKGYQTWRENLPDNGSRPPLVGPSGLLEKRCWLWPNVQAGVCENLARDADRAKSLNAMTKDERRVHITKMAKYLSERPDADLASICEIYERWADDL